MWAARKLYLDSINDLYVLMILLLCFLVGDSYKGTEWYELHASQWKGY